MNNSTVQHKSSSKLSRKSLRRFLSYSGCLALATLILAGNALSLALPQSEIDKAAHEIRFGSTIALESYSSTNYLQNQPVDAFDDFTDTFGDADRQKSPFKAAVLSLVLPGLGQFYNGSHPAKIGGFLAVEALFLSSYSKNRRDGNNKVAEFELFAQQNWSRSEYDRYLFDVFGDTSDAGNNYTHHLPSTESQQYFEMIGKYDQFSYGWTLGEGDSGRVFTFPEDDYDNGNAYDSPLRSEYNNMRASANDFYGNRDKALTFAILNHLVSAVDATIGAMRHNRRMQNAGDEGFSFQATIRPDAEWNVVPTVNLSWRF